MELKYFGRILENRRPGGSMSPWTYAKVTNWPPGLSTRIISSRNSTCIDSGKDAHGNPDTMQSTWSIPAELHISLALATESWNI